MNRKQEMKFGKAYKELMGFFSFEPVHISNKTEIVRTEGRKERK
jgi:hypothetical protein